MATRITVALEDDLEGGPADETVRFTVGGADYEIDLNKKNARAFRRQLAPFIDLPAGLAGVSAAGRCGLRGPGRAVARSGGGRAK
jgi:hypothetical protein